MHPHLLRKTQSNGFLRKWSTNTQTRWMYRSSKRHGVNINMTNFFCGENILFGKKQTNAKFDLFKKLWNEKV